MPPATTATPTPPLSTEASLLDTEQPAAALLTEKPAAAPAPVPQGNATAASARITFPETPPRMTLSEDGPSVWFWVVVLAITVVGLGAALYLWLNVRAG